jgi:hypothetical protein
LALLFKQDPVRLGCIKTLDSGLARLLLELAAKCRVVVVLNVIVSPSWEVLGNFGPAIAVEGVVLQDERVLLLGPAVLLDLRVQVVMPSTS